MGHWAKDCNKAKKPAAEEAANVKMVHCQLVSPTRIYVTATVEGRPIRCLLDSGCERSVIGRILVPSIKLTCSQYSLSVANKTNLPDIGETDLWFIVKGHSFVANVSVLPAIDEFLLEVTG